LLLSPKSPKFDLSEQLAQIPDTVSKVVFIVLNGSAFNNCPAVGTVKLNTGDTGEAPT
jgi:hypothetical protein